MVSFQIVGEKELTFQQDNVLIKHWVMCYPSWVCLAGLFQYVLLFSCPINNYQNKVKRVGMERLAISLVSEKTNFTGQ